MKNENSKNPIFGIVIAILGLGTAIFYWLANYNANNQSPIIIENNINNHPVYVKEEPNYSPLNQQPIYIKEEPKYITAKVIDRITLSEGQIAESLIVKINGETRDLNLSSSTGRMSGDVNFTLPEAGYYNYEVRVVTWYNSHPNHGYSCSHTGYGSGNIFIGDGSTLSLWVNGETLNNSIYTAYLKDGAY